MLPTIYKVENIGVGFLAIMARPSVDEWVEEEFGGLAKLGVAGVVSLLEVSEANELRLSNEEGLCSVAGLTFESFPIPDRGIPESESALSKLVCDIYRQCAGGNSVVVHCRAGIGRSGLVAAAVLMHTGVDVKGAFQKASNARGVSVPDTDEQALWLEKNREVFCRRYVAT